MFDVVGRLAVQSWCFRHFKARDPFIAEVKKIGLSRVELCGLHVDLGDEASFEPLIADYKKAGISIPSIGVQKFTDNPALEEKWFKFAKLAGCKTISATFELSKTPEAVRTAEKLADKYDINVAIHNHGGHDWLGNSNMLSHIAKNSSPRIGYCLDSAWVLAAHEDPLKVAEKLQARLYGVHIKDFIFNRAGHFDDVVVGTGNLNLPAFLALINNTPHCVSVTLEYEGDVENPGPKLRECVEKIKAEG